MTTLHMFFRKLDIELDLRLNWLTNEIYTHMEKKGLDFPEEIGYSAYQNIRKKVDKEMEKWRDTRDILTS